MIEGTGMSPEWFNQTTIHPIGLVALAMLALTVLVAPRRFALVPLIVLACFVSPAQRVVVTTFDFNFLRILVLCGWIRVLIRHELTGWRWKPLDVAVLTWALFATVTATLLHATMAAFVNRLGLLYDAVGGRRHYARQPDEIKQICCGLRRDLIARKFPTAGHLRRHLELFSWG